MGGAAENRSGAVVHQDEVGDIDRQFDRSIQRMFHPDASIQPALFGRLHSLFRGAKAAAIGQEFGQHRVADLQSLSQRVIGRDGGERSPKQGVGAGGVNLKAFKARRSADRFKRKLQTT